MGSCPVPQLESRMYFAVLMLASSMATPLASEDLQQQPANKSSTYWACPEYGMNFNNGRDIADYDSISSWQECGHLCHMYKTCTHWTWSHPRSNYHPRRCFLKSGDDYPQNDGRFFSGEESCYNC